MLSPTEMLLLERKRVGHLGTVDEGGRPHVVPVCYALAGATLYITIDGKPKRQDRPLRRLRNIAGNPQIMVTVDHYDEDWSRLAWVMLSGQADILAGGAEHDAAQALLVARYPQLKTMHIADLPVIALRIAKVGSWAAKPSSDRLACPIG